MLQVTGLKKHFVRTKGILRRAVAVVKAVDGVSFSIRRGETLSLVGESGCGKTTTGRCILRAIEPSAGQINFDHDGQSVNMVDLDAGRLNEVRKSMAMIFQDPYSSLNPRMTIVETIGEPYVIHRLVRSQRQLEDRVARLLRMVHLDATYMRRYPHAFSGGQRQRIAIARALSLSPSFIVADEPVSALDVSVQAQILNLLKELQAELGLTYLFVAHNLAVVKYISDRVAVMYLGKIVELAETRDLFLHPRHPYTEALLSAVPKLSGRRIRERIVLPGDVADPADPPPGCAFHPRCRYAQEMCQMTEPALVPEAGTDQSPRAAACHFSADLNLAGVASSAG